jgi:hypothetical protein
LAKAYNIKQEALIYHHCEIGKPTVPQIGVNRLRESVGLPAREWGEEVKAAPMKTMARVVVFAGLALFSAWGCSAPKPRAEVSPTEVRQAVAVAFALPPEASLRAVLERIKSELQLRSTPAQVTAYLDVARKRSPLPVVIKRTQRGQPIVRDVTTRETIVAYFVDRARVHEVSILFVFDDGDALVEIDYTQGVWER